VDATRKDELRRIIEKIAQQAERDGGVVPPHAGQLKQPRQQVEQAD
jgi:hypothetical protein